MEHSYNLKNPSPSTNGHINIYSSNYVAGERYDVSHKYGFVIRSLCNALLLLDNNGKLTDMDLVQYLTIGRQTHNEIKDFFMKFGYNEDDIKLLKELAKEKK